MSYTTSDWKVYCLAFTGVPRQAVLDFLDTRPEVANWFAVFAEMVLIISKSDLTSITGILHVTAPAFNFFVAEVEAGKVNGWLSSAVWDFINNPGPVIPLPDQLYGTPMKPLRSFDPEKIRRLFGSGTSEGDKGKTT
jgi:hypothetical protein